jgi:Fe/S biogenesis protein NfuA
MTVSGPLFWHRGGQKMLTFTDGAKEKVQEYLEMSENDPVGLRVMADRQGRHRFQYNMSLVMEDERDDKDRVLNMGAFDVYVDPQSAEWLEGATVDFVSDFTGSGFRFDNPQAVVQWDDPVAQRVQQVIDEKITPSVAGHGGWVELVSVDGDAAVIQFGGGCQGCGMSEVTLKQGIETVILQEVPEIKRVMDDTDHSSGESPYY